MVRHQAVSKQFQLFVPLTLAQAVDDKVFVERAGEDVKPFDHGVGGEVEALLVAHEVGMRR